jgi:predicted SprT family Zn-dependent metalloprotease
MKLNYQLQLAPHHLNSNSKFIELVIQHFLSNKLIWQAFSSRARSGLREQFGKIFHRTGKEREPKKI